MLNVKSASDYLLPDLTQLLNLSFENYLVPIQFNLSQFQTMLRKDGIDLNASRVLLVNEQPAGIGLIARRATLGACRLAAMGIVKNMRGLGAGSWFMGKLIEEARERQDHEMFLEVIEQNEYALRLYQKCGFQSMRRLIGLIRKDAHENIQAAIEEIDLSTAGKLISQHGLSDLPWQLTGETIAQLDPTARAYRNGPAIMVISNPDVEHIAISSLLVEPEARGKGLSVALLKNVIAHYQGKTWHVPAIFPEEFGGIFKRAGFEQENLSQWQMRLTLS